MIKLVPTIFKPTFSTHSNYREDGEHRIFKFKWAVTNVGDEDAPGPALKLGVAALDAIIGLIVYDPAGNVKVEQNLAAVVSWDDGVLPGATPAFRAWYSTRAIGISRNCSATGSAFQTQFDIGTDKELPAGPYAMEFRMDPLGQYGLGAKSEFLVFVGPRTVIPLEDLYF